MGLGALGPGLMGSLAKGPGPVGLVWKGRGLQSASLAGKIKLILKYSSVGLGIHHRKLFARY